MSNSQPPARAPSPARERILHAAQTLFYEQGIRSTGIDRVIAEAKVTKVTVYRHFPSKDDLIRAYLEQRHAAWTEWFRETLLAFRLAQTEQERRDAPLAPLLATAQAWFTGSAFRGCAFANAIAEAGPDLPAIGVIAARHKQEVRDAIATLLPAGDAALAIAWAATLALDGAAVNAQRDPASAEAALIGLRSLLDALTRSPVS